MTWGILMIGSGFVNNWHELFGIRILLGVLEVSAPKTYFVNENFN